MNIESCPFFRCIWSWLVVSRGLKYTVARIPPLHHSKKKQRNAPILLMQSNSRTRTIPRTLTSSYPERGFTGKCGNPGDSRPSGQRVCLAQTVDQTLDGLLDLQKERVLFAHIVLGSLPHEAHNAIVVRMQPQREENGYERFSENAEDEVNAAKLPEYCSQSTLRSTS